VPLVEVEEFGWCCVVDDLVADHAAEHPAPVGRSVISVTPPPSACCATSSRTARVARDLRSDLDASAAALLQIDTYLGTLYRWAPRGGNLRQQLPPGEPWTDHPVRARLGGSSQAAS
jgi:hypothetical protein